MKFHLTIARPAGWHFAHCFDEVAESLVFGLRLLGHECSYQTNAVNPDAQNIVLGPHLCDASIRLPEGSILYNLEQIGAGSPIPPALAAHFPIWDYSERNIAHWKEHGIDAIHVPIGYVSAMTRINPTAGQEIDVLFYGSMSQRREVIIGELMRYADCKVVVYQGFGRSRDELIARSKVMLNVHFYDKPRLFEWPRVSYLLANRKAVVSEQSDDDPPALAAGLRIVPYTELADACRALVADRTARYRLEQAGFECFRQIPETEILRRALSQMGVPCL